MRERRPKLWHGGFTPLMRLGTYVFNGEFPEKVSDDLLRSAADYCQTRIADFQRRKNNHKNRCSIYYYAWWLVKIQHQIGARL